MHIIGLDIGTTTVCAAAKNAETGKLERSVTLKNNSFIDGHPFEKLQNPDVIWELAVQALSSLQRDFPDVAAIGVTGQMHGILYCDDAGKHCSPLYIWQDGRGNEPFADGLSYCAHMTKATGYKIASGFGLATHCYNTINGLVPENARTFCAIHDYIVMRLCGLNRPLVHVSDAASFGLFNLKKNCFDKKAIASLSMDTSLLPEVTAKTVFAGKTAVDFLPEGVFVTVAIGDNQASFLGAAESPDDTILVNMGTGSQVTLATKKPADIPVGEVRPFIDGKYLFVGSSLCGGRAYQILETFFRGCAAFLGADDLPDSLFSKMDALSENAFSLKDPLKIACTFCGTRENPDGRASIGNIGTDNFTPEQLICGVLRGTVDELYELYDGCRPFLLANPKKLVGSGNGIRKSAVWQKLFEERFRMELTVAKYKEEAACGAADFAARALKV